MHVVFTFDMQFSFGEIPFLRYDFKWKINVANNYELLKIQHAAETLWSLLLHNLVKLLFGVWPVCSRTIYMEKCDN